MDYHSFILFFEAAENYCTYISTKYLILEYIFLKYKILKLKIQYV